MLDEFVHQPRIAYFTMEIALRHEIPTYSGGLGILAGDTIRSAADLELPLVAVSLASRAGYFRQEIDPTGNQVERPDFWEPGRWATPLPAKVGVTIEGRTVWIGGWLYIVEGHMGGRAPVILLDTDLDENLQEDREITHYLYGGDEAYRLKQEAVLGIGGTRMLQALGFNIRQYHMNEGHSALLVLEILKRYIHPESGLRPGEFSHNLPRVRQMCNFTTHTPVEAGHDKFSYELVEKVLGNFFDMATLKTLAGEDVLNLTRLAVHLSEYINGVAERHAEVSNHLYPGYQVNAITNGVHPYTWTCPSFAKIYDTYLRGWCNEPVFLVRADRIPDEMIWEAHLDAKKRLIERVRQLSSINLLLDRPILGFARRMTAYKRPDLLFSDLERLKAIARQQPFQLVMAGKAHPQDEGGKRLIRVLHDHLRAISDVIQSVYLPNYDMEMALTLVSGVDVWLNTPLPPLEASGTSGMKAAFNGIPHLSVLDGWWLEGCIEGVTGWAIGEASDATRKANAESLYEKLEHIVLPLYYKDRPGWIAVMKNAICKNASFFNSHRMMRRYVTEAYIH